jgi:hypothetical protein
LCGRFLGPAPPHFSFKIKKENVGARRAPSTNHKYSELALDCWNCKWTFLWRLLANPSQQSERINPIITENWNGGNLIIANSTRVNFSPTVDCKFFPHSSKALQSVFILFLFFIKKNSIYILILILPWRHLVGFLKELHLYL